MFVFFHAREKESGNDKFLLDLPRDPAEEHKSIQVKSELCDAPKDTIDSDTVKYPKVSKNAPNSTTSQPADEHEFQPKAVTCSPTRFGSLEADCYQASVQLAAVRTMVATIPRASSLSV